MRTEWAVLAGEGRARIFARVGGGGWQDIRDVTRSSGNAISGRETRLPRALEKMRDMISASTGKEDFLARLGRDLRVARKRGDFDRLFIVAPPAVLSRLDDALDNATRRKIAAKSNGDLVGLPVRDARREIARLF